MREPSPPILKHSILCQLTEINSRNKGGIHKKRSLCRAENMLRLPTALDEFPPSSLRLTAPMGAGSEEHPCTWQG